MIRLLLIPVLALTGITSNAVAQEGPPPTPVRTDAARLETVSVMRLVTGNLRAFRRSSLASEESGRVVTMHADVGQTVAAGEIVAEIDATLARHDVDRLAADREAARANVERFTEAVVMAQRDLSRFERAQAEGAVFDTEIEDARTQAIIAQAQQLSAEAALASADAELALARAALDKRTIRAPFAAQVVAKHTELGAWLGAGDPVVDLVAIQKIDAYVDVPESMIRGIAEGGQAVTVRVPALDKEYTSADAVIIADGDELARTFPVRIRIDNPNGILKPGMSIRAMLPAGRFEEAITVHKDAVRRDDGGSFAFMNVNGQAFPARFDVLWRVGDRVVISDAGIRAGTPMVIEGNERLFPTQTITDIGAAPQAEPDEQAQSGEETPPAAEG